MRKSNFARRLQPSLLTRCRRRGRYDPQSIDQRSGRWETCRLPRCAARRISASGPLGRIFPERWKFSIGLASAMPRVSTIGYLNRPQRAPGQAKEIQ